MGFRVDVNMLPDQMTGENCEIVLRIFQSDSGEQDRQKEKHTHTKKQGSYMKVYGLSLRRR